MQRYREIRDQLVEQLLNDALAHEVGRIGDIGIGFDEIETALVGKQTEEFNRLRVALEFWELWIDARNHDWRLHKPLVGEDWPLLAREIAGDLEADRDIRNSRFLAMMEPQPPFGQPLREWFRRVFARGRNGAV